MGMEAPHSQIRRYFASIDGIRQIHYRRAGSGPPVLLLHQSPKSSREMIPVIEGLAKHFTCIAPDTPGNGNSDPLTLEAPTMWDYGDNIARLLDALGISKVALYGFHTGASVAGAFASRYPERVHVAILNGFVSLNSEERTDIMSKYLTPFELRWDGSHLVWLWARLREQTIFYPWYLRSNKNRLQRDVPAPTELQEGVLEFLRSGDEYRKPYGAAFMFEGDKVVSTFKAPTIVCGSDWDPAAKYMDRLPEVLPENVSIERLGNLRGPAVVEWLKDLLGKYAKGETPAIPLPSPLKNKPWQDFVSVSGGQLHVRRTEGKGCPLILQHEVGDDNTVNETITRSLMNIRPVLAFDMPGHGESDNTLGAAGATVEGIAQIIGEACESLGINAVDVVGLSGGSFACLEFASQRKHVVKKLMIANIPYLEPEALNDYRDQYAFSIAPDVYGGHLLKCWHALRQQGLFWPWYNDNREGIIWQEPQVDTSQVHKRLVALLKAGDLWLNATKAQLSYDVDDAIGRCDVGVRIGASTQHHNFANSRKLHEKHSNTVWVELPANDSKWAGSFI